MYENKDILKFLESPAIAFYEYAADNGELLKLAAKEIRESRNFIDATLKAHSNLDVERFL